MKENILIQRWYRLILGVLILVFILLAGKNSFVQDDAFISFRYARNLSNGYGLVWNPGDTAPVEGYTNFLWTVVMAGVHKAGVDPVIGSKILGILAAVGTMSLLFFLARMLLASINGALVAIILLGTNYTYSCYATGGVETQFHTLLIMSVAVCAFYLIVNTVQKKLFLFGVLSILGALAVLSRMDAALLCGCLFAPVLLKIWKERKEHPVIIPVSLLLLPGACIVLIWWAWKLSFYGSILPNTFNVKAGVTSTNIIVAGLRYIFIFMESYIIIPVVILMGLYGKSIIRDTHLKYLFYLTVLWSVYIMKVGGDFMEFRMLVYILPFFFILVSKTILLTRNWRVQVALMATMIFGSFFHGYSFDTKFGIETISALEGHMTAGNDNWIGIGKRLREVFGNTKTPVIIATTAAGAIPYYSGLKTVDMLGLNDTWVAKNGILIGQRQGHRRAAPAEYLTQTGVNLVLGHPVLLEANDEPVTELRRLWFILENSDAYKALLPEQGRIVELPMPDGRRLCMLYLTDHAGIDEIINNKKLTVYTVPR